MLIKNMAKEKNINIQEQADLKTDSSVKPMTDSVTISKNTSKKDLTVLFYMAGDNNLSNCIYDNFNQIEKVGSTDKMNLVAQMDLGVYRNSKGLNSYESFTTDPFNCKRYLIKKDNDTKSINSELLQDLGKTNMAHPKILSDFITYGIKKYPAEKYILIISDHGYAYSGICDDKTYDTWLKIDELKFALEDAKKKTGKKLDILGFDACYMANTETLYDMKNEADYIIASSETENGKGWNYEKMLKDLNDNIKTDTDQVKISSLIVDSNKNNSAIKTLSVLDAKKTELLYSSLDELALSILNSPNEIKNIKKMILNVRRYGNYEDLGEICKFIVSVNVKR